MGDRYDDMVGADLAAELGRRELPISGKVDELRARLREDDERRDQLDEDGPDDAPEGEETEEQEIVVPEPREPLRIVYGDITLTEEQARELTRYEAQLVRFVKHVAPIKARKYCAGDRVVVLGDPGDTSVLVLPYGISIPLTPDQIED